MATREPWHEGIDQHPQVGADQRVIVVAEVVDQVLGQLRFDAHIRLAHLCDESVQICWLCVSHLVALILCTLLRLKISLSCYYLCYFRPNFTLIKLFAIHFLYFIGGRCSATLFLTISLSISNVSLIFLFAKLFLITFSLTTSKRSWKLIRGNFSGTYCMKKKIQQCSPTGIYGFSDYSFSQKSQKATTKNIARKSRFSLSNMLKILPQTYTKQSWQP